MTGWVDGPMVAFDVETTGVRYENDLILSASVVNIPRTGPVAETTEYLDHGLSDPIGAGHIHRMNAGFLKEHGADPADTLDALCQVLAIMVDEKTPLVGMNVVFDLTMLEANCRRYGVPGLTQRIQVFAVDALILDKAVEPYRKGKRTLEVLAKEVYRIPWDQDQAHSSAADALAAARVAWRIGRLYPPVGSLAVPQLHQLQVEWKKSQDASFAEYRRKKNEPVDGLDGVWPVKQLQGVDPWA